MKRFNELLLPFKKFATWTGGFRKAQRTLALAFTLSLLAVMPLPQAYALGIPNPIASFTVLEDAPDTVFNLDDVFSDATSYSVLFNGNSTLVDASISGSDLILNYAENQFGSALIRVSATDGVNTVANSFTVTVIPVNDAPSTTPAVFPDQTTFEGIPVTISFTVNDVEDDLDGRQLFVTPNVVGGDSVINEGGLLLARSGVNNSACTLTMTPVPGAVGQATISVIVSDNGVPPLSAIRSFKLTVIPSTSPNNPPVAVINVSKDADLDEGDPELIFIISVNGVDAPVTLDGRMSSDPDGDPLTYAWFASSGAATPGPIGEPTASAILPHRLAIGDHTIFLSVSDGTLASPFAVVHVKVIPVSEAIGYLIAKVQGSSVRTDWKLILVAGLRVDINLFAGSSPLLRTRRFRGLSPCEAGVVGLAEFKDSVEWLSGPPFFLVPRPLATELMSLTDEIINNVACE